MKSLVALAIIAVLLAAGCVQSSSVSQYGKSLPYLKDSDFVILNTTWAFEDNCDQGNYSVGYAVVRCYRQDLKCEVYVNNVKSTYGLNALQDCSDGELTIAEMNLTEKPNFVAIQSENSYYFTRRDVPRIVEICCSYLNQTSQTLDRDNEICNVARLDAQCPKQTVTQLASGFGQLNISSWALRYDGTLTLSVKNGSGQDVAVTNVYMNGEGTLSGDLPVPVPSGSESQNITVIGKQPQSIGNKYAVQVSIEYYNSSTPNTYANSTGIISSAYS